MAVMILDPDVERRVRLARDATPAGDRDEMWDGVLVMAPMPNNEHFYLSFYLTMSFAEVIDRARGDQALPGGNVSDRVDDWTGNYRGPASLVVLAGGKAIDRGAYWLGGPDLVVEVIGTGQDPNAKLGFYAGIGTREVLILDRHPWAIELHRLVGSQYVCVGRITPGSGSEVGSEVLPLAFRFRAAKPRPTIVVRHTATAKEWMI